MFSAIGRYPYFILASVFGELTGRFGRSRLGLLWSILTPLGQAAIYATILCEALGAKFGGVENGCITNLWIAGMAAWGLFSEVVNRSLSVFIEYPDPAQKIALPRRCSVP